MSELIRLANSSHEAVRKLAADLLRSRDPRKDIGLNILSLFHYGRGVQIVSCETLEEAMEALEE